MLTARCSRENVCSGCRPRVCQPWPVPALSSVAQGCAKGRGGSGRGAWAPLVRCCPSGSQVCVLISHRTFICSPAAVLPAHSSSVLAVPAVVPFAPSHLFPPCSPPASPSISRLSCPTSLTPRTIRHPQCICRQQDGQPGWCFSRYCGYPGPTVAPRGLWGLPALGLRRGASDALWGSSELTPSPAVVGSVPSTRHPQQPCPAVVLVLGAQVVLLKPGGWVVTPSCAWLREARCACCSLLVSPPAALCLGA